jgi:hypothetical protein
MKFTLFCISVIMIGAVSLSSCASTTVTGSWRDEAYMGRPNRALVVLVTAKPTVMRLFEDNFSQQLKTRGIDAVSAYTLMPSEDKPDKESIAAAAEKINADSLFITRLVDKKSYEVYYPGSVYVAAPGYYTPGWGDYYNRGYTYYSTSPGYAYEQAILYVETQLWDVKDNKLIWSVITETQPRGSLESEVQDFVHVIMKNLAKNRIGATP